VERVSSSQYTCKNTEFEDITHFHTSMRFSDTGSKASPSQDGRQFKSSATYIARAHESVGEGLYTVTSAHQRAGVIIDGLVSRV